MILQSARNEIFPENQQRNKSFAIARLNRKFELWRSRNMKYNRFVEKVRYEKIRRRHKSDASYNEEEYKAIAKPQVPGSIHLVPDRMVQFDYKRNSFKEGDRPGVVTSSPESDTYWQTRWVPFSTRTKNRNRDEVVFLTKSLDKVDEDCVALPFFGQSFHCKTLGPRSSKLPNDKLNEIILKERGARNG